jgi:hypothetical protein
VVDEYVPPDYPMLLLDASGVADHVAMPLETEFGTGAMFLRPPDGDRIVVWGGIPAPAVMGLYGGDVVDLARHSGLKAMGYDRLEDVGWSPDGSRIAVLAEAGHERHRYVKGGATLPPSPSAPSYPRMPAMNRSSQLRA